MSRPERESRALTPEQRAFQAQAKFVFKDNFNLFKAGQKSLVDLLALDYASLSGESSVLEYVSPQDASVRLNEKVVAKTFFRILDPYLVTYTPDVCFTRFAPKRQTAGLRRFAKSNPGTPMAIIQNWWDIERGIEEEMAEAVIHKRYADPKSKTPVASVWCAIRFKPSDYQETGDLDTQVLARSRLRPSFPMRFPKTPTTIR